MENDGEIRDAELELFNRLMDSMPLTAQQRKEQLEEFYIRREERQSLAKECKRRDMEVLGKIKRSSLGIYENLRRLMGEDEQLPGHGPGKTK